METSSTFFSNRRGGRDKGHKLRDGRKSAKLVRKGQERELEKLISEKALISTGDLPTMGWGKGKKLKIRKLN